MGTSASVRHCQNPESDKLLKAHTHATKSGNSDTPALFGVPLQCLREKGCLQHGVPPVLKRMVEFLEKYGLQQSGVFRVCGSVKCCKTLRECLDRGESVDLEGVDVPTVAALLKLYLRELPGGLIPHTRSMCMQQVLKGSKEGSQLVESLKEILDHLPDDNYNFLSYLLPFLSRVAAHSQWNHMTSENLATVFGPCIFRVPEGPRMLEEQTMCNMFTLHLLEKHAQLIPNTHYSYTGCTHSCNNTYNTYSTLTSHLQQEQFSNSETDCDDSVGGAKETSTCPPSSIDTLHFRFSNIGMTYPDETGGNMPRETETEKNEEAGFTESDSEQESCQRTMDHSSFTCSDTEVPTPESSRTDIDTHSDTTVQLQKDEFPDTSSQEATQSNTSRAHSPSCETQTASRSSHLEAGCAHTYGSNAETEAKHESSDYGFTHSQSPETHTTRPDEEEADTATSLCITDPPTFFTHYPIADQDETLNSEQVSASCAVTGQSCVIEDDADCSSEMSTSSPLHLKGAIRSFEESNNYKNTLITHPEVVNLRTDLSESREQPKEFRLRHHGHSSETSTAHTLRVCLNTPTVEYTANVLTQRLKEKRLELNLPQRIQDMSSDQLALEKLTLQKSLLYYEKLHGRPSSKEDRSVMKELYGRYRLVKQAVKSSTGAQSSTKSGSEVRVPVNPVPADEDPVFTRVKLLR